MKLGIGRVALVFSMLLIGILFVGGSSTLTGCDEPHSTSASASASDSASASASSAAPVPTPVPVQAPASTVAIPACVDEVVVVGVNARHSCRTDQTMSVTALHDSVMVVCRCGTGKSW